MTTTITKAGALSALVASLALTGCGGGSGSSANPAATLPTIGGVASKGLMQNALVTAYCGPRTANTPVGTAYTDNNGAYSLTLTASCNQPVVIVVGVNPAPNAQHPATQMLDEVRGVVTPPANFELRAIVPSATSGTISQPVTPLSDMAAAVALTANTLTAAAVGSANLAIINTVLGGDSTVFNAIPVAPAQYSANSTTAAQKQLATVLAAISAAAATANPNDPAAAIQSTVQNLATAAAASVSVTAGGYAISPTQPTTTPIATISSGLTALSSHSVTLDTSASGAPSANVAQSITSDTSSLQNTIVPSSQSQIASGGTVTVTAPATTVATAIANAKAMIQAIRTNLIGLGNSTNTGFLQTQASAMASDATTAGALMTYDYGRQLRAITQAALFAYDVTSSPNVLSATAGVPGSATTLATGETLVTAPAQVPVFGKYYERTFGTPSTDSFMRCRAYVSAGTGVTASVGTITRTSPLKTGEYLATVCAYYPFANDLSREAHFVLHQTVTSLASASLTYVNRLRTYNNGSCSYYQATCDATDAADGAFGTTGTLSVGTSTMSIVQNGTTTTGTGISQFTLPANSQLLSLDGTHPSVAALSAQLVAATQTNTSSQYTFNISGGIATSPTTPAASAQFNTGSYVRVDTTSGAASMNFAGSLQTTAFKYDGTFSAAATNANSVSPTPASFSFTGTVSSLTGSVATPFLSISRLQADATAKTAAFTATFTNNGAQTQISGDVDNSAADHSVSHLSFIIPNYTFTATGTNYPSLNQASTLTITAPDNSVISLTRSVNNVTTTVVKNSANEQLGTGVGNNQINFVDGSYVVLN